MRTHSTYYYEFAGTLSKGLIADLGSAKVTVNGVRIGSGYTKALQDDASGNHVLTIKFGNLKTAKDGAGKTIASPDGTSVVVTCKARLDAPKADGRARNVITNVVSIALVLVGLTVVAMPVISGLMASARLKAVTSTMSSTSAGHAGTKEMADAEAYNARLGGYEPESSADVSEASDCEHQMDVDAQIAYIEMPSIAVTMPVCHGTSDDTLMSGIGHLGEPSLPVGGESSNGVLSARSGMSGERAFDDMCMSKSGDIILVHALGKTLAYSVTGSVTISQDGYDSWVREIAAQKGKDILALVTCAPSGVNDRRLIAHAERTECTGEEMANVPVTACFNPRCAVLGIVVLVVIAVPVTTIIVRESNGSKCHHKKVTRGQIVTASAGVVEGSVNVRGNSIQGRDVYARQQNIRQNKTYGGCSGRSRTRIG